MSKRSLRLANERRARKLARQSQPPCTETSAEQPNNQEAAAQPVEQPVDQPEPRTLPLTDARLEANRRNSQHSTGPTSSIGLAATSQNRTQHGLARHVNGTFTVLPSEDPAAFASFKQSLLDEHQPASETESVLVTGMAEAHWLADRAQHLLDTTCLNRETGDIADAKKFSLFLRYKTTHARAFHKCMNDLAKLRSQKKKEQSGFEAQKIKTEKHEMKKEDHTYEILKQDFETHAAACRYTTEMVIANSTIPGFGDQFREELAKRGLPLNHRDEVLTNAA